MTFIIMECVTWINTHVCVFSYENNFLGPFMLSNKLHHVCEVFHNCFSICRTFKLMDWWFFPGLVGIQYYFLLAQWYPKPWIAIFLVHGISWNSVITVYNFIKRPIPQNNNGPFFENDGEKARSMPPCWDTTAVIPKLLWHLQDIYTGLVGFTGLNRVLQDLAFVLMSFRKYLKI